MYEDELASKEAWEGFVVLQLLFRLSILVVLFVAFQLIHGSYVTGVVKRLVPIYRSYDSSYYQWQRNRLDGLEALSDIEKGANSPHSLRIIEKYRSNVLNSYQNWTDSQILAHYSKKIFSGEQDDVREIFRHISKMHRVASRALFMDIKNHSNIFELSSKIRAEAHREFTIHDYSEWGAHEQPDFGRSLRWELEMIFVNGYIPREKNYGEWIP